MLKGQGGQKSSMAGELVFNIFEPGTMGRILNGQTVGTLINGRD